MTLWDRLIVWLTKDADKPPPERYIRSSSETPPKEAERLRRAIIDKLASLRNQQTSVFEFTPPRYDEEFIRALSKLDEAPDCLEGHRTLVDNATTLDVFKGVSI